MLSASSASAAMTVQQKRTAFAFSVAVLTGLLTWTVIEAVGMPRANTAMRGGLLVVLLASGAALVCTVALEAGVRIRRVLRGRPMRWPAALRLIASRAVMLAAGGGWMVLAYALR